ncbi:MAG: hypothetical protein IJ881_00615 [Neisseriaceae bacterium]|nr:hypothetical protein [Neisseriaceae bacterium]
MSDAVIVAIISSVVAPTVLFILQLIKERNDGFAMRLRRVEIMQNLQQNPDDDQTIMNLYDEYRKRGGNSYIKERITEWKKERSKAHAVVKRRK